MRLIELWLSDHKQLTLFESSGLLFGVMVAVTCCMCSRVASSSSFPADQLRDRLESSISLLIERW